MIPSLLTRLLPGYFLCDRPQCVYKTLGFSILLLGRMTEASLPSNGRFLKFNTDRRYISSSLWKCDSVCLSISLWPLFYGHDRMQAQRSDWVKAVLSSRARNLLHGGDTNRLGEHVKTRSCSKFRGARPYTFVHFSILSVYYKIDDVLCHILHVTHIPD